MPTLGQENELLLMAVLDCLFNSVSGILRKNVDKKSLCDNMEVVMLAMDEMLDNGMIMESDPQQVNIYMVSQNNIPMSLNFQQHWNWNIV